MSEDPPPARRYLGRFYSTVECRVEYTHPLVIGSCSSNCLPHRFLTHPLPNPIQLLDSTLISQSSANPPPPKTRHCAPSTANPPLTPSHGAFVRNEVRMGRSATLPVLLSSSPVAQYFVVR
ncbi:hypothetical protein GGI42DRAFT_325913 [Trichoderma sp. SZMC 28013]